MSCVGVILWMAIFPYPKNQATTTDVSPQNHHLARPPSPPPRPTSSMKSPVGEGGWCPNKQGLNVNPILGGILRNFKGTVAGKCSTPTQLFICSSFSRENGHLLLICSPLSTIQIGNDREDWQSPTLRYCPLDPLESHNYTPRKLAAGPPQIVDMSFLFQWGPVSSDL